MANVREAGLSGSLAPTTFVQVYAISAAWIVGGNWLIAVISDDTTLRFEPLWPAQLVKRSATWTLESHLDCRASNACGDRFRHGACKRRKAKTDHLVERRFRILLTFHD